MQILIRIIHHQKTHPLSLMMIIYFASTIVILSSLFVACDNFSGPPPGKASNSGGGTSMNQGNTGSGGANSGGTSGNTCDTTNVSFSKTVLPILEANCTGCHSGAGATAGVNLSNHAGVRSVVSSGRFPNVLTASNGAAQMPPGSRLSACDIAKIQAWVRKGAAND